jgi:hypothetical protein
MVLYLPQVFFVKNTISHQNWSAEAELYSASGEDSANQFQLISDGSSLLAAWVYDNGNDEFKIHSVKYNGSDWGGVSYQ